MKDQRKFRSITAGFFMVVTLLFAAFFVYIGYNENISVYSARLSHSYIRVEDYELTLLEDENAPQGVVKQYRWTMDQEGASESCMCFYMVHHYARVYYDGELVYSMEAAPGNRIGATISSNWVTVPVHPGDVGKEVVLLLTPLFSSGLKFEPEIFVGSHYAIAFDVILKDLPRLFVSTLCIVLGLMIIAVQVYFMFWLQMPSADVIYLGAFAVLVGLWRITDLRCAPMIFSDNPMVLGYITIGSLFLCCIPMLMFLSTFFSGRKANVLLFISAIYCTVVLGVLVLQVKGLADFRELLTVSHIMMVLGVGTVAGMMLFSREKRSGGMINNSWKLALVMLAGVLLDLILYYITQNSTDIMFTIVAFVVYAVIVFVTSIRNTTKKVYVDPRTGLANKIRWNDLLNDGAPVREETGMIMVDLNGLKRINDNYGHEAGDAALLRFSGILREIFPSSSLISHWGGDEFAIMLSSVNMQRMNQYIEALTHAVDMSNAVYGEPHIYFAIGYAFAVDYPGLNHRELLSVADSRMYVNKREWYAKRKRNQEEASAGE